MRGHNGYSFVELLVVLSIIAIMAGLALPNMLGWRPKQRLLGAASDVQER